MVLGFILYETIDIIYNVGAITYNGSAYLYRWYYGMGDEYANREKEIEMLRLRLEILEKRLLANGSSENHETTKNGKKKHNTNQ